MELLFARLPPSLRKGAIRRVAKFLLESTFTSVAAEASVLCNAVAWADSQVRSGLVARGYARLDSLSCGSLPARCFGLLAPQLIIATAYELTFRASCPTVLIALLLHLPHAVVNCARARPLARHFCFFVRYRLCSPGTAVYCPAPAGPPGGGDGEGAGWSSC
jgi:hypothetical protein